MHIAWKMNRFLPLFILSIIALVALFYSHARGNIHTMSSSLSKTDYADGKKRASEVARRITPQLTTKLEEKQLTLGSAVFIRIFKQERELEIWLETKPGKAYMKFQTYPIAAMSGKLGPKLKEGDKQAPEGFYFVNKPRMNPQSRYHLAFNIGYPNTFDRAHNRTGSALMVHGDRVSIGCFAMTDEKIEEIYTLCDAALNNGQSFFRVHCFPFRMVDKNLSARTNHQYHRFWLNLKTGYDHFERERRPPNTRVKDHQYIFENAD